MYSNCLGCGCKLNSQNLTGVCGPCFKDKESLLVFLNWKTCLVHRTRQEAEEVASEVMHMSKGEDVRDSILHVQMSPRTISVLVKLLSKPLFQTDPDETDLLRELVEIGMGQHRV